MADRKEYQKEYYGKRKCRLNLEKIKKLKEELSSLDFEEKNPYVEKIKNIKSYNLLMRKKFNLEYDIGNLSKKIHGFSKKYLAERDEEYKKYWCEWDLKNRIVKWRLFRKAIHLRTNDEPTKTQCLFNNVFCPKEIIKENKEYRPDLMYLTQIQADDPEIHVTISSDWAKKDEKKYRKKEFTEEDYKNDLKNEGLM